MKYEKGNYLPAVGFILIVLLGGIWYFSPQINQKKLASNSNESISTQSNKPAVSFTPKPETTIFSIPDGWTWQENAECGLKFALPPSTAPYTEPSEYDPKISRSWRTRIRLENDSIFKNSILIIFQSDPDMRFSQKNNIFIECAPNPQALTAEQAIDEYAKNNTLPTTVISKQPTSLWGQNVVITKLQWGPGEEHFFWYFVTTKSHIYRILKIADSSNNFTNKTADQIFDSIQFIN